MESNRRICAAIDLDAIRDNFKMLAKKVGNGAKIMAVVKADGYGHGAVPVALMLEERNELWGFGVATIEEALELREAGIVKAILILGFTFPEDYERAIENNIIVTIFGHQQAEALDQTAKRLDKKAIIHLAIDTGMNRIGFADNQASTNDIAKIYALPNVDVDGVFTHFARADENDLKPTKKQLKRFEKFVEELKANSLTIPIMHSSNSAAILQHEDAHFDVVRAGICLYGLYPSKEMMDMGFKLSAAMSLTSHITHIKTVEAGEAISYGGTHVTQRTTTVATIPIGYADGYPRSLSNKGYVLINGHRARVLGRICMDQFMVDISDIPDVAVLDEVVLLGRSQNTTITMETLGDLSGRFNYEFACGIAKRVPRNYKK